ncbi:MAG: helix-turn-helix domain-containing protein [Solirubrobacteraceae bacterium]
MGGSAINDEQVRAIHTVYLAGGAIDELAEVLGGSGAEVRSRMEALGLPMEREREAWPASPPALAEQHIIVAILAARIDALRGGTTLQHLAAASHVTESGLYRMKGSLSDPSLMTVLKVCAGLGVEPGELLHELPTPQHSRRRRGWHPSIR